MKKLMLPICFLLSLCLSLDCEAITRTWNSTSNTNWHRAANWSPRGIPTANDKLIINNTNLANPVISSNAKAREILLSGQTLTINAGVTLEISPTLYAGLVIMDAGHLINKGTLEIEEQTSSLSLYGMIVENNGILDNQLGATFKSDVLGTCLATFSTGTVNNYGRIVLGQGLSGSFVALVNIGTFTNHDCKAAIQSYGTIDDQSGNFINRGQIAELASGNSDITTNEGIIQNLNGGNFTITNNTGEYLTSSGLLWTGCVDNNWSESANWITGAVPSFGSEVRILDRPNDPVLSTSTFIKSIVVNSNSVLEIASGGRLTIGNFPQDALINNGQIDNRGTIEIGSSGTVGDDGMVNNGTFNNDGTVLVRGATNRGLFNKGTFTNNHILSINQRLATRFIKGIINQSVFTNSGGNLFIENVAQEAISNQAGTFSNLNGGSIQLGMSDGDIGGTGISNFGLNTQFINDNSTIEISNTGAFTSSTGWAISNSAYIENSNNGYIAIGGAGAPTNSIAIRNTGTSAEIQNNACSTILVASDNTIFNNAVFHNQGGIIVENASGTSSSISTNTGQLFNLNGGTLNVTSGTAAVNYDFQATKIWTGFSNNFWLDADNWVEGAAPTSGDDVFVFPNTCSANQPTFPTLTRSCKSLTIAEGSTFTLPNLATLNLEGVGTQSGTQCLLNQGTINNDGTINLSTVINTRRGIENEGIFNNNSGTINGYYFTDHAIYNYDNGVFTNTVNGEIHLGRLNTYGMGQDGIHNEDTAVFINAGTLKIDLAGDDGVSVQGDSRFENTGNLHIGTVNGGMGHNGLYIKGSGYLINTGFLEIDEVADYAIENVGRPGVTGFENKSGATLYIGAQGGVQNNSIFSTGNFTNEACATIRNLGPTNISATGNFNNYGLLLDEGPAGGSFSNNYGVVQNLNGGSFNISNNSGALISYDAVIWTGCSGTDAYWHTPANWLGNAIPTSADRAVLTGMAPGTADDPVVQSGQQALAKTVVVASGALFTIESSANLRIANSTREGLKNEGTCDNYGTLDLVKAADFALDNYGTFNNKPGGLLKADSSNRASILNRSNLINDGTIEVDNSTMQGIYQISGTFDNNGIINIGQNGGFRNMKTQGIEAIALFNNNSGGVINIDNVLRDALNVWNADGELNNAGTINIGTNGMANNLGRRGFIVGQEVNNQGVVNILNTAGHGLYISTSSPAAFNNNGGTLNIGQGGTPDNISANGIENFGEINNTANGAININNTGNHGLHNIGIVANEANISIGLGGPDANIGGNGLHNLMAFDNLASGTIDIDYVGQTGLHNEKIIAFGGFNNVGTINIALSSGPGNFSAYGINNMEDFDNQAAATLTCNKVVFNTGTLTNSSTINIVEGIINDGTLQGNGDYTIEGNWENNGTFSEGSSTVTFSGAANDTIQGTNPTTFNQLNISKTNAEVLLGRTTGVEVITLNSGHLNLNGFDFFLSSTGSILQESELGYIYSTRGGEIVTIRVLNSPTNNALGNIGLQISAPSNLGNTIIKRGHTVNTIDGAASIERYYLLEPTNNSGLNADVQLAYLDAELNGQEEGLLEPYRYDSGNWTAYDVEAASTSNNAVELLGIETFDTLRLIQGAIKLAPMALLEGSYAGSGLMNDDLRSQGLLPSTEPFTALGFTHVGNSGGEAAEPLAFTTTGDNAIVDWVFLELRDKNDASIVLHTRSALLQSDGDIVDLDGSSTLTLPNVLPDHYYLTIRHRNHLGVRSAATVAVGLSAAFYDFSIDPVDVAGGTLGIADLGDGFYALISGDFDHNGQVQNSDAQSMTNTIGLSGYLQGDLDMNGQVQNSELQLRMVPNIGKGVQY
ncbi:MAG: hypothetical protein AAGG75_13520 [Bacteroidota bacterium]